MSTATRSAAARGETQGFGSGETRSAWRTVTRGLRATPHVRQGLAVTVLLGLTATAGRLVGPVVVQRVVDHGLLAPDGPTLASVGVPLVAGTVAVVGAGIAGHGMYRRLIEVSETALYDLRTQAFRHLHDLSMLHQAEEQRGELVSRVTGDVDRVSEFLQRGGVTLLTNSTQLVLATAVMAWYSVTLTLVVLVVFVPLAALLRVGLPRVVAAHRAERRAMGTLLARLAESVVGAEVVRAYGIEERTDERVGEAVREHYEAGLRAGRRSALMFSTGETFAAVASGAAAVVGVGLGLGGGITAGELLAFLFLVSLFVAPMQTATEVLNEAQTAVAGWGRVVDLLDTEPDITDPDVNAPRAPTGSSARAAPHGHPALPDGPLSLAAEGVGLAYPDGTRALRQIDVHLAPATVAAAVGETGAGKTTFAKLACRLLDPTEGVLRVGGVDLRTVGFAELRRRVTMVPQDGFLFDDTVAGNIRRGHPHATDEDVRAAVAALGLAEWVASLPEGARTPVGERGTRLSAGERQLVALTRALVTDPDLLVLDEPTSAVDPATEARLQEAMGRLMAGRSVLVIAHRLSTAATADEVWVFDDARLVQRAPHATLVDQPGRYRQLVAGWRGEPPNTGPS